MSIETRYVDAWLDTILRNDTILAGLVGDRIYNMLAPPEAALPLIVWSYQGGTDLMALGAHRILANVLYQVKTIAQGFSFATLRAIADRCDTLLHGTTGAVAGGLILSSVREQIVQFTEIEEGVPYRHLGGLYRIQVQATN